MSKIANRIGEINYNTKNEKMTIIAYRSCEDIDIQFEDGVIIYNRKYGNFKKGLIKHPIRYEESFAYYIEVELGLNLDDIWNWERNKVNPYEIYKSSNKKVWLYCQEKDYHNFDRDGNKIGYEIICNNFYGNKSRCSYCGGNNNIHFKDSLAYKYPNISKMIAIEENNLTFEDCYNIACKGDKRFYFKCLDCNTISNKKIKINQIINLGYSCKKCSDGNSIPNKFMYNLLTQLNINFKSEYSPYYFRNTQHVDFLLTDYNIIIEMDGSYGNHVREYDYWRDFLNMKYGGYKTIRINLTNNRIYNNDNTFKYIKEQIIKSELSSIFDLTNINWKLIWKQCQKSKVVESWNLWNNGIHDTAKIGEILNLDKNTIRNYLKRGVECGRCDYTIKESKENGIKKISGKNSKLSRGVICLTTKRIFFSLTEAGEYYCMNISHLSDCCKNKRGRKTCGKLEDGTKLVWRYINWKHNKIYRITESRLYIYKNNI